MANTDFIRSSPWDANSEIWKFKPAFRRHRRKLARIVVDQWLKKTKEKLLVLRLQKIYQRHLKILCFQALTKFAAGNREKRRKNIIATEFRFRSIRKRALRAWIAHHRITQCRWEAVKNLCWMVRTRRCADAFWIWLTQVQDCIQTRRKLSVAEKFRTLSLLSTCLGNWRLGLSISKRNRHLKRLALGYWAHRRLSIAWRAFVVLLDIRHATLKLSAKRRKRLTAFLFQWWHYSTVRRLRELQRHASCLYNKLLRRSFTTLRHHVSQQKIYEEKRERALRFYHDQCMHYACKVWRDFVALKHVKRRLKTAAETHFKRKLVSFSFNMWRRYVEMKRKKDVAILAYERKLRVACMKRWKDRTSLKENVTISTLRRNQDVSQLMCVIRPLKLIRPEFPFVRKWKLRKNFKMKKINRVICYQARSFCKKLFHYLKMVIQSDFKKSKKDIRLLNSTISNLRKHEILLRRDAEADTKITAAHSKKTTECQTTAPGMLSTCAPRQYVRETCGSKRIRAQPRRPKHLIEPLNLDDLRKTHLFNFTTILEPQESSREPSQQHKNDATPNQLELESRYSNMLKNSTHQKLIREELLWTDDLLGSFSKLKDELDAKESQLSALKKIKDSVSQKAKNEEVRYLEQKIRALRERQTILFPSIQELTKRANFLQWKLLMEDTNIAHLD